MNKLFKTEAMKRLKKSIKSKRGTTLVELVATVAILAIVASLSFEAMHMAAEEYRRAETISEAERSISLLQDNLNMYAKNATSIEFVDNSGESYLDIEEAIRTYIYNSSLPGEIPMQDAENNASDEYIDLFLYRSGDFTYTIGKYVQSEYEPDPIVEISNIKEINFSLKQLTSSFSNGATDASYLFDYAIVSPTGFEMLYSEKYAVSSGEVLDSNYSNEDGSYSVMTGTVLNNIKSNTSVSGSGNFKICEDLTGVALGGSYKGDLNFVVIRTVPREAK